MLHIRDHMSRLTHFLTPQLGLAEALDRLHHSGLSGLPVLDDQQQLVGFLSEQDCIPSLITGSYHCDTRTQVEDMMSRTPLSVDPDDSILDLARQMTGAKPKIYPVLEQGKVIGIISRHQVMQALNQQMKGCHQT
ncbi:MULTISPECIES: CBS domain-containing protein [Aeromonas]|jgi:predicted transcriptional regulator|uniref:CBS domain-containing protein n=3 Tax=Gammaproteobacteria TaxID=1236 RepID=A0A3L0W4E5_ECOLX|nr:MULTISPECIES: CBS domain-containing protein [Aeromonas]ELI6432279.1 CBS domain-containing protein [Aeromonas salmonicida subsp. salmonicida]MBP6360935.1 CBS domain-containing protein [Aeromonas sp.]KTA79344.1 CBS domain containing protein [Aeromonas salmonicida]MBP8051018.1 CBS domain-containing protein [Aeromonas sp.]MCE9932054.1 CBS domain-containing protein [Aeromonas salmonicida]